MSIDFIFFFHKDNVENAKILKIIGKVYDIVEKVNFQKVNVVEVYNDVDKDIKHVVVVDDYLQQVYLEQIDFN